MNKATVLVQLVIMIGVAIIGAILTVVGGSVAILTYTGYLNAATTDQTKASVGSQSIDFGIVTANVAIVVCFVGMFLLAMVLLRFPRTVG